MGTTGLFARPAWLEPRTAYIHVPFCGHHCGYCDFAVTAGQDHLIELYLDALEIELSGLKDPRPVETLFIGGGTPTYLSSAQLERLLAAIRKWLVLVPSPCQQEFSIESTPESLEEKKAEVLAHFGVTRVSLGVQSFQSHLLQALDRQHGIEQIARAIAAVRQHHLDLSLDLIFASPGQQQVEWAADLEQALALKPDHLSTYGLTYEKGTPLWKRRERGMVPIVNEDTELSMYLHAVDTLTTHGFEHYEISNFARAGKRCRHNERYWANEAYFGFGVGAARYVEGSRELNVRDTKTYVKRILSGESPTFQQEQLSTRERAFETIAIQLRRSDGIDRNRFLCQTGYRVDDLAGEIIGHCCELGLLKQDADRISLTRQGKCLADGVVERVMRLSSA